MLTKVKGGSKG